MPYPDDGSAACPIEGCKRARAPGMVMCATCWHRVPEDIQGGVYAAWRQRRNALMADAERYRAAEERHEAAKKAAIEAVEGEEGAAGERPAVTRKLLERCASVIWAHEAHPCNMMPLNAIEDLAEDLRTEIFK